MPPLPRPASRFRDAPVQRRTRGPSIGLLDDVTARTVLNEQSTKGLPRALLLTRGKCKERCLARDSIRRRLAADRRIHPQGQSLAQVSPQWIAAIPSERGLIRTGTTRAALPHRSSSRASSRWRHRRARRRRRAPHAGSPPAACCRRAARPACRAV
jgi:hypothetical protein